MSPACAPISAPAGGRRSVSGVAATRLDDAATTRPDASRTWMSWLARVVAGRSGATADVPRAPSWPATSATRVSAASVTSVIRARCRRSSKAAAPIVSARATTITAAAVDRTRTLACRSPPEDRCHPSTRRRTTPLTPLPSQFHPKGCAWRSAALGVEAVAHAADRFDRVPGERGVDLLAEVPDVHLDDIVVPVERRVPDVGQDLGLADRVPAVPHQELEQAVLARRERDLPSAALDPSPGHVEGQVARGQHHRPLRSTAPDQRPQPRHQDQEAERLGQV